jgi:putative nucleotidyltransferase with HDIG domain
MSTGPGPSAATSSGALPSASGSMRLPRDQLASVIPRRPRVSIALGLLLALGFAALVAPAVTAESWLGAKVEPNRPSPITVRVPPFAGADDGPRGGGVVVGRGESPGLARAGDAQDVLARQPRPGAAIAAYALILFALAAIFTHHCRRSNRGRLLRVQLVNLALIAAAAIAAKVLMLTTTVSVLAVPVALAAIIPTLVIDRTVGLATGVLAALVMSLVVPFDLGVATILLAQASVAGLIVPDVQRSPIAAGFAGAAVGAVGAGVTYGIYLFLSTGAAPWAELSQPLASPWVAAITGGAIAMVLVPVGIPLYQKMVGEITHGKLVALEDLAHPMLRQIATKAPGTWQHSLAMANMAELAANAIGASGRLVRVGAYFHDLGKSLQPKYFIENLEPGEVSPHEKLPPEVSCDAIFAHVTEGLTVARRAKLPERIIDFMHMHHGNGVLEYFWARCQEQGNPNQRTVEDFRYPGVPPQSRETAILAICDAVEAASRTLKRADEQTIGSLVQRIVYGKLHLGQLDDSGLSMADLRRISDSLRETIKHAHHGRIEYPWQKAEAAEAAAASGATTAPSAPKETTTQRLMKEPRLDSLDSPRPMWQRSAAESTPPPAATTSDPQIGVATTAVMGGPKRPEPTEPTGPVTLQGRDRNPPSSPPPSSPPSDPPRARPSMTPSDAAISVAPTVPPDAGLAAAPMPPQSAAARSPSGKTPAQRVEGPTTAERAATEPAPELLEQASIPKLSAATIATPSTVMAAVAATPIGTMPTTLPGVTTDRLKTPPPEERVTAKRPSQPHPEQPPQGKTHITLDHFPPPVEDSGSGDVISARPRPDPIVSTSTDTAVAAGARPKRQRQQAMIVEDQPPPAPPAPPDAESASTQPRLAAFRPSQVLPLPAPPTSDPEIRPPAQDRRSRRPSSQWSEGLASRVDRAFEDEVANSTPVHGPSPEEIASLSGNPDTTKLTPIHQIQQLVRESVSEDTQDDDISLFDGWDRSGPPGAVTEPHTAVDADGRPLDERPRTIPPPPPGASAGGATGERLRKPRSTEEVEPDNIEASIEEVPRVSSPMAGPPPATRSTSRLKRVKPPE